MAFALPSWVRHPAPSVKATRFAGELRSALTPGAGCLRMLREGRRPKSKPPRRPQAAGSE
jgi:hypothetical protein